MSIEGTIKPPVEVLGSPVLPIVNFDKSLSNPEVPYSVAFDSQRYAGLLRDMGFSDDQIRKTKINISTKSEADIPFLVSVGGSTSQFSKNITIYCDPFWRLYTDALSAAERLANNEGKWLDEYRFEVLHTKRLPDYLKKAPPGRSIPFAHKLIENGAERLQTGTILHETQHKADLSLDMKNKNFALFIASRASTIASIPAVFIALNAVGVDYVASAIGALMSEVAIGRIIYSVHPLERSARQFASKYDSDPRYRGILTLAPRENANVAR